MFQSKYLQDNVKNIQLLMTLPSLQNFESRHMGDLLRLSRIREYEPKECIIEENADDRWLYFLLSGSVAVIKGGVKLTTLDKPGELFGEMSFIDKNLRSASVCALEKTVCLAVNTSAQDRVLCKDDRAEFLVFLYKIFSEFITARLRLTNEELIKAKKQIKRLMQQKK